MSKAFNKVVVSKKKFEDLILHVERHQQDHPKVAQLKRQYPLVLSGKNIETDATDPAPSKDDRSNETNYDAQDAGTKAEGEEQANKEGSSSTAVRKSPHFDWDTNVYQTERDEGEIILISEPANDLSISVAEAASTQILASEPSANIKKELGKLTVIEEGNEQEHSQKTVKPTSKSSKRKRRKH